MTRRAYPLAFSASLALVVLIIPSDSRAYQTWDFCAVNNPSWSSGGHSVWELACSSNGFTPATASGDTGDYASVNAAMRSAYWMWVRDGTSRSQLFIDTSQCKSGPENGAWFDGTESSDGGISETWYEPASVHSSICPNPLGCTGMHYRCGLKKRFYSVDIMMNQNGGWNIVDQNTVGECLSTGLAWSLTMLHEIGHAYGLDHEEGAMNMMRTSAAGARPRNCHVGQGFRPFPFPDDMNGLMKEHRSYSTSNPPSNYSGTAFFLSNNSGAISQSTYVASSSGTPMYIPWSIESFYPPAPATIYFRAILIPNGLIPTFSYATGSWTFPSGTKFRSLRFLQFSGTGLDAGGFSSFTQFGETVADWELAVGTTYRVWLQVDPTGSVSETDEGDNVFPTAVFVRR